MLLETRLARCIAYRNEAMKRPLENALYIADLNLSIAMFSKIAENEVPVILNGWENESIDLVVPLSGI